MPNVLVVDDQPDVRQAVHLLLKGAGYSTDMADSPKAALAAAKRANHDLILVDMNYTCDTTSGDEGLKLVTGLRADHHDVPVIAMTAWSTVELAVAAMQRGACDFIPKPWDNRHFLSVIGKHLQGRSALDKPENVEWSIARSVQQRLLPPRRFSDCGVECECASLPAGEISGDLYDFFRIDSHTVGLVLGDISGKGIGAALLAANLQATIRSLGDLARHPAKLLDRVNRLFSDSTRPEHYATLFYATYDSITGDLRYVNCGHPAPVVIQKNGSTQLLDATSTVIGMFQQLDCNERITRLGPGDRLIVYSDGFSEAKMDEEAEDWALSAIRGLAPRYHTGLADVLAASSVSEQGNQQDDVTVIDMRVL
jgi:sigma-B regulation protein RsbU (phosphoserine phosphatase)